jgi:hypothetical protein
MDERSVTFRYRKDFHDSAILTYRANDRYELKSGRMTRVQPFATNVGGFFREWLDSTEAPPRWRDQRLDLELITRCPGDPRLWQVEIKPDNSEETRVFMVEESGAENLRMVGVRSRPQRACPPVDKKEAARELPLPAQ